MSLKARNRVVIAALGALVAGMTVGPSLYMKSKAPQPIVQRSEKLTGSQVQRGMYMNSGSKDAGADPDWDMKTGTWRGYDKK